MSEPTLILITGYARSGKDTLAEGIMSGISSKTRWAYKRAFADTLKEAANEYVRQLGLDGDGNDFYSEPFKVRNRRFLVEAGMFARSLDVDVFAACFAKKCLDFASSHGPGLIVAADWRYLNELRFCQKWLHDRSGWRIVTVEVNTAGIGPANEEEGMSIAEIRRQVSPDVTFTFSPDNAQLIKAEGKNLARQLGL